MTPDQRTALRESIGRRPLSVPLVANAELIALLDAADQRDRAAELLQQVVDRLGCGCGEGKLCRACDYLYDKAHALLNEVDDD